MSFAPTDEFCSCLLICKPSKGTDFREEMQCVEDAGLDLVLVSFAMGLHGYRTQCGATNLCWRRGGGVWPFPISTERSQIVAYSLPLRSFQLIDPNLPFYPPKSSFSQAVFFPRHYYPRLVKLLPCRATRELFTCFNAPPQGTKTRNQRALFSFDEKGSKTAPPGPFGSLWV